MRDGSVVTYRDDDPSHIRQERFRLIYDSEPLSFAVTTGDGAVFAVDLVTGTLTAGQTGGERHCIPEGIDTPLRVIYYKRMFGMAGTNGSGMNTGMEFFVVGWQTTTLDGRNLRLGLKVFPEELRYEVTGDF